MNVFRSIGNYLMNVLISIDQLGNSVMGGDPDETISSRLGKAEQSHGGKIPWTSPISRLTAEALNKIDKNHCKDAIEKDEGEKAVTDKLP
jgi:hypothetical protein